MARDLDNSALEVRYLLGDLSEQEEENFEQRYFADDRAFEELQATEGEVIDAYVRGELPDRGRQHFKKTLAKSRRLQERVAIARVFSESLSRRSRNRSAKTPVDTRESWWQRFLPGWFERRAVMTPLFAAGLLLMVIGGALVLVQSIRLRSESQRLATERAEMQRQREEMARSSAEQLDKLDRMNSALKDAQVRAELSETRLKELQQQTGDQNPRMERPLFATLMLTPGSLRSGGSSRELNILPENSSVQLQLALLKVNYRDYRVTIVGPGNKPIHKTLKPSSRSMLTISLPARLFSSGDYTASVSGITPAGKIEPVDDYEFRVIDKRK